MGIKEVIETEKVFLKILYQRDSTILQLNEELEQKNKLLSECLLRLKKKEQSDG